MAVTKTPRFGLTRWSDDGDPWNREDWDADNAAVEALAVGWLEGTGVDRPAASPDNRGFIYRRTDAATYNANTYSISTGAAWLELVDETQTLDQLRDPVNNVNLAGRKIIGLAEPSNGDDAATLATVLARIDAAQGSWTEAGGWVTLHNDAAVDVTPGNLVRELRGQINDATVRVAGRLTIGSTTNLGTAGGALSLDGVTSSAGITIPDVLYRQASTGSIWRGFGYSDGTTRAKLYYLDGAGPAKAVTTAAPFAWATGDQIIVDARLENV